MTMSTVQQFQEAADKATQASAQADNWANGPINTTVPTDSGPVPTIAEFTRANQERADNAIDELGWVLAGDFTAGCTVTDRNQYVLVVGGAGYRWDGALPKVVTPGGSPSPVETGAWVLVGDATLRSNLAGSGGTGMIGGIGFTTPEQFGYVPGAGAASFAAAAAAAISIDGYIKLDGKQYDIGISPVEMHGARIMGNGVTSVNGYFKNPGRITGVKYGLISVGQTDMKTPRVFQLPPSAIDGKFLVNFPSNSNIWGVGMNNDRSDERDTFMVMRRGNGGDGPNWEHIRSQQIFYGQTFAFQGLAAATLVGTFTDFSATPIQVGFPSGWGSSFAGYNMHFIAKRTTTPADSIQRVVEPDRDGYVNVGVFVSSTGSPFDVYVDGVLASSGTTAVATTSKPRIRQFKVKVGFNDSYTVKIVHTGVAGKTLTVLGFNVHRPRDTYGSINYDKFALYFDVNAYYASGVGAGDYAMSNDALGFFGSYHGGEIALTPPVWRVDGSAVSSFTPEKPYAGKVIDLMEQTRIWDIVDTHSYQRWAGNGRHEMSITLKGTGGVPFEVKKMYLGMNGTFDAFSRVIYPEMAEGISGASTPDFLCGMTNMVVQENPTTGQVVYTHCNIEEGFPSAKGGVFIKTTDETGSSYQKVYFAWVYDSPMNIDKVSCQLVKVFC